LEKYRHGPLVDSGTGANHPKTPETPVNSLFVSGLSGRLPTGIARPAD
jgi:hypothetical protein